jgi:lysophospholipase L1-like esterase
MKLALLILLLPLLAFAEDKFDPNTVIFIGSSTMGHWKPRMEKDFAGIPTLNFGENGTDFHYLHETVPAWAKKFPAKRWVIYSGDNDLSNDPPRTPAQVSADMVKTVELIREQDPGAEIFVLSLKKRVNADAAIITETNKLMSIAAEGLKDVIFVDTYKAMKDKGGDYNRFFDDDGIHLNSLGYDLWRDTLRPYLLKKKNPSENTESSGEVSTSGAN